MLQTIPIQTSSDRRVEVLVSENQEGRREILLRDLSFSPGVGWYVQKTIRLDPEHVDALIRSLCCSKAQSRSCVKSQASCETSRIRRGQIVHITKPRGQWSSS